MDQPRVRHQKRTFRLGGSRAVSSTLGAENWSDMSCQMLRRGLIETWDQTKREVASGFKGLKRGHVQTQPLPLLPRMLEALPSPGFSKATINAMQRPRKKSRCEMFAFLATAVTLLKVGIGAPDNFFVSGWNILFSTKLKLATTWLASILRTVFDVQKRI